MKHVTIYKVMLPNFQNQHVYLKDGGKLDYLAQIIMQIEPLIRLPEKIRFPSEIGKLVYPFVSPCRGALIDTCVTVQILMLDRKRFDIEQKLNEILNPHNIHVTIKDRPTTLEYSDED
jgi:hypothetical protein